MLTTPLIHPTKSSLAAAYNPGVNFKKWDKWMDKGVILTHILLQYKRESKSLFRFSKEMVNGRKVEKFIYLG